MILQALTAGGVETENRLQLGGTPIVREAIIAGEIDIYLEYTGNAAFFFSEADSDVWKDPQKAYARAAELDLKANDIVWLEPAPANNTWAIAVRSDLAELERPEDHERLRRVRGGRRRRQACGLVRIRELGRGLACVPDGLRL